MKFLNSFKREDNTITVTLEVMLYEEGDYSVAYCPALELSAYGDNNKTAKSEFKAALTIFIEETMVRGTLEKELLSLGWALQKVPEAKYEPPRLNMEELLAAKHHSKLFTGNVAIPV